MRILMVSIFSQHFFNWTLQLKDAGHEIYWLDLSDSSKEVEKIDFVYQIINWRKKINFPGRYSLKKYCPFLFKRIDRYNQKDLCPFLLKKIEEIRPDVIQSFEMHSGCTPILEVMQDHPEIKWIYSSWGNDIFFYLNGRIRRKKMKETLPYLDYMFADCKRDFHLAKGLGFTGKCLGPFPGGGGYDLKETKGLVKNKKERRVILVKGYEHRYGRCNMVLKALVELKEELKPYEVIVFGATKEVEKFVREEKEISSMNFKVKGRLSRREVLELMGKSLIYIGNNVSDGMPNTLLEAIIMGAFPIQSNPGNATAEIIEDGVNGYLIHYPENSNYISKLVRKAIKNKESLYSGIEYNTKKLRPNMEREVIRKKVLESYEKVQKNLLGS